MTKPAANPVQKATFRNLEVEFDPATGKGVIHFDANTNIGPSKSGDNLMISSSGGNQYIPGTDIRIGVNIFKPNPVKVAANG